LDATRICLQLQVIRRSDTMNGDTLPTRRIGLRAISRLRDSSLDFVNGAINSAAHCHQ